MLCCPRTKSYPLTLEVSETDDVEVEYNREFILRMLPRLDWTVLRAAASSLKVPQLAEGLPAECPDETAPDDVLQRVHSALLEWHVVEGKLISAGGPVYDVSAGIPNLTSSDSAGQAASQKSMVEGDSTSGDEP